MPQPETYDMALRHFDLSANQIAYVGHDAIELTGAANAGATTIAFNHAPEVDADLQLERFLFH